MNKVLFAVENYKVTQDLIKFIDQKAGALLVVYGAILTVFTRVASSFSLNQLYLPTHKFTSLLTLLVAALFVVFMLIQMYYIIFKIIKPRIRNDFQSETSIIFFGHIANMSAETYVQKFSDMDEEQMLHEVTTQLHRISVILNKKSHNIGIAMNYLYVSFALLMTYIILSSFISKLV